MYTKRFIALLTALVWIASFDHAFAFDNEPDGFAGWVWGTDPATIIKSDKKLRKEYSVKGTRQALEAGQIAVVATTAEFMNMSGDVNYLFTLEHLLYGAEFSFEDRRPEAMLEQQGVLDKFKKTYGEPEITRDQRYQWVGETTVLQIYFPTVAQGYKLEVRIYSRDGFDEVVKSQ